MTMKRNVIIIIAAALLACSCTPKSSYYVEDYESFVELGDNGFLMTDDGSPLNVINNMGVSISKGERKFFICDILNESSTVVGGYDVEAKSMTDCPIIQPVKKSEVPEDVLGTKPVFVNMCWISGGYINFQLYYEYKEKKEDHSFQLVIDDINMREGLVDLELRHSDNGDWGIPEEMALNNIYLSFPITKYLSQTYCSLTLEHKWYKDYPASPDTDSFTIEGDYSKPDFIQNGAK